MSPLETTLANKKSYNMNITISVFEINQKELDASVEILVHLGPVPFWFNETEILVPIKGGGDITIVANKTFSDTIGKHFVGNASTSWHLTGGGEFFPYDFYTLRFNASTISQLNFTLTKFTPVFRADKWALRDAWKSGDTIDDIPFEHIRDEYFILLLPNRSFFHFVQLILPIILCYYLLGTTMFLDPIEKMTERLTVFVSLFIFAPTFLFAIYPFLPYRSSLTIPELLLANLIVSLAIFGIASLLSKITVPLPFTKKELPADFFGTILAMVCFILLYYYLFIEPIRALQFYPTKNLYITVSIFLYSTFGYFFASFGLISRSRKKTFEIKEEELDY